MNLKSQPTTLYNDRMKNAAKPDLIKKKLFTLSEIYVTIRESELQNNNNK